MLYHQQDFYLCSSSSQEHSWTWITNKLAVMAFSAVPLLPRFPWEGVLDLGSLPNISEPRTSPIPCPNAQIHEVLQLEWCRVLYHPLLGSRTSDWLSSLPAASVTTHGLRKGSFSIYATPTDGEHQLLTPVSSEKQMSVILYTRKDIFYINVLPCESQRQTSTSRYRGHTTLQ